MSKLFKCPICESDEIEGRSIDIIEYNKQQMAEQECSCLVCDAQWIDRYLLYHTEIINHE